MSKGQSKRIGTAERLLWMLTGFAVAVLAGFSVDLFIPRANAQTSTTSSQAASNTLDPPPSNEVLWAYQNAFRKAAQEALPVVVKVDVVDVVTQQVPSITNPFSFFFGQRDQTPTETRQLRRAGLGSGVIVRRAGTKVYVLTNDHVVGDADEINVTLHDGRSFESAVVGTDSRRDLALIAFDSADDVPVAKLGDSDSLAVGDWVFAIGNPLGFESTVTSGIISAVGRRPAVGSGISELTDYIQTDAAINQGNSGGALVNLAGEVVGINSWIASQSGGSVGLGFAIPINNAKRAIDEFIDYGAVEYGWLGIGYGGSLTADVARSLSLPDASGAFVGSLYDGSPAAEAGIAPGDVVREINGQTVSTWNDLVNVVASIPPGQSASFRVWHDGRLATRNVQIGARLSDAELQKVRFWPGIVVTPLTSDLRDSLGLKNEPGSVVIADVVASGPAAAAGIRRGDIVRKVNDQETRNLAEFYNVVNTQGDGELVFRLVRQGREFLIGMVR